MNKQTKTNKKNHNYKNNGYLGNLLFQKKSDLFINFPSLSQVLE